VTLAPPREALTTDPRAPEVLRLRLQDAIPLRAFQAPDPFQELTFPSVLAAKRAIAQSLGLPLAKLSPRERQAIDGMVRWSDGISNDQALSASRSDHRAANTSSLQGRYVRRDRTLARDPCHW
jgi:hypothetical protein